MTARLSLHGISKRYPAVVANDGVSLSVQPGEIHAVLGENGAGKSTLMKIIYGVVRPDAGELYWNGKRVSVPSPNEARELGIAMVFQHFSLFETLTAAENVWLGRGQSGTLAAVTERVRSLSAEYGLEVDPRRPVHSLSVGERQRVEIVRALLAKPELLILDEPTSVLPPRAVQQLFQTLRTLAASGCSILYISHKLDEIRELCQRCTVLRAGRVSAEVDPRNESNASLSRLMIGAEPRRLVRPPPKSNGLALSVRGLRLPQSDRFRVNLQDIELEVHGGEIVGVAGVSGNGQPELMAALSGEDRRAPVGSIALFGQDISQASPRARRQAGLHFVPEERLGRAAVPELSLAQNTLLTRSAGVSRLGLVAPSGLARLASELIRKFRVKAKGADAAAQSLSGGNLQKFIVGRELDAAPRLLIVSQPTWGVDVGAAAEIRAELVRLREAGAGVRVVSEELDELFELSDRLVVMARGRMSPVIDTSQATVEQVGIWMSGLWPGSAAGELGHA